MKKSAFFVISFIFLFFSSQQLLFATNATHTGRHSEAATLSEVKNLSAAAVASKSDALSVERLTAATAAGHGKSPSPYSVIPFALLLLMIATGPLFYAHFWHKNYPKVAIFLAFLVVSYYIFLLHNSHAPIHAFFEYFQFIALLSALYIASGGIMIKVDKEGTPMVNVIILLIGAVISNIIGTTGASMLLIRPFIRLNKARIKPYHVVFFIFMVSNVGGCLTPIGDPPLFLGFLKGVPFEWTLIHSYPAWFVAILIIAVIFFFFDRRNKSVNPLFAEDARRNFSNKISVIGTKNFLWLALVVLAIFLDPVKISWLPGILEISGEGYTIATLGSLSESQLAAGVTTFSFIRELIMFSVAILSFKLGDQKALRGNEFNFEPIREVAFIFIGIFGTMMPALELVATFAASPQGSALITEHTLYWGTGIISGFLDNAPTYLNFLTAAIAAQGGSSAIPADVINFANQVGFHDSINQLAAISISAVFFGAMTYIGNGPNFMVKSIAEQIGIKMPSFFGYIIRYSIPILLPVLFVIWVIFFLI